MHGVVGSPRRTCNFTNSTTIRTGQEKSKRSCAFQIKTIPAKDSKDRNRVKVLRNELASRSPFLADTILRNEQLANQR